MKFIIEHLSKRFEQKEVLRDIDFTFEEGRIYGLLGRNGAGKTTLFNCLNRDIKADSGSFCLEENGVRREVAAEDIGYVLSTPTVPEFLTGREFLKFFMDINSDSIRDPRPLEKLVRAFNRQEVFQLNGPDYVRSKGQVSGLLRPWYQKKSLTLSHEVPLDESLYSPDFASRVTEDLKTLLPFYRYFAALCAAAE